MPNHVRKSAIILSCSLLAIGLFWYMQKAKIHSQSNAVNIQTANQTEQNKQQNSPPTEAITACTNKTVGDACEFMDKNILSTGTCDNKPGVLACKKNDGNTKTDPNTEKQNQDSNTQQNAYNIEQAISDNAQLNTLAFGALGFITGNTCSDSFLPPGKVADFFGFQYLRDTTQAGKGHSTDFVTNAANNVLAILTDEQKAKMLTLAKNQSELVNQYGYDRFPLMVAFRRQLTNQIPTGTTALSKDAIMDYSADLYELDAKISLQRAQLFGDIINSLSESQKTALDKMVTGGFASWEALSDQINKQSLSHDEHVLVMTYASEMFGWYAGDVEADTYFCPERQGNYFGGFYIKDAPAMGNAGYTIDESITGNKGQEFINNLSAEQKPIITNVVTSQKNALNSIVEKRRAISTELRQVLNGISIDEDKIYALAREYGALDGEISYYYATEFSKVYQLLSETQLSNLTKIRDLDDYPCASNQAYLYSEKISFPSVKNTDFLFE